MQKNSKLRVEYYILILWIVYIMYLCVFGNLLLFPKDGYELLLPAFLQVIAVITSNKLFKAQKKSVGQVS